MSWVRNFHRPGSLRGINSPDAIQFWIARTETLNSSAILRGVYMGCRGRFLISRIASNSGYLGFSGLLVLAAMSNFLRRRCLSHEGNYQRAQAGEEGVLGTVSLSSWVTRPRRLSGVTALEARAPRNVLIVATANKLARIAWAVLSSGQDYRAVQIG